VLPSFEAFYDSLTDTQKFTLVGMRPHRARTAHSRTGQRHMMMRHH